MCHKQSCPIQPAAEGSFPFVPTTSFMIVQAAKKGFGAQNYIIPM